MALATAHASQVTVAITVIEHVAETLAKIVAETVSGAVLASVPASMPASMQGWDGSCTSITSQGVCVIYDIYGIKCTSGVYAGHNMS